MATKSISDLVMDLQKENEALKGLARIANQYCKQEFGYDVKAIHEIILKAELYDRRVNRNETNSSAQVHTTPDETGTDYGNYNSQS